MAQKMKSVINASSAIVGFIAAGQIHNASRSLVGKVEGRQATAGSQVVTRLGNSIYSSDNRYIGRFDGKLVSSATGYVGKCDDASSEDEMLAAAALLLACA